MKDLLEYIVKNLVSKPDSVSIDEESGNGEVSLYLTVDPADMGLIIGKGGQTIHAIRKVLTVRAISENVRVNLQLSEPETPADTPASPARSAARRAGGSEVKSKVTEEDTSEVSKEENKASDEIASSDKSSSQ